MNLRRLAGDLGAGARLVGRLATDRRVPRRARIAAGAALVYAIVPIDVLPDRFPVLGRVDDAFVFALALHVIVEAAGDDLVREMWTGSEEGLERLETALEGAVRLVPGRIRRAVLAAARS